MHKYRIIEDIHRQGSTYNVEIELVFKLLGIVLFKQWASPMGCYRTNFSTEEKAEEYIKSDKLDREFKNKTLYHYY